MGLQEGGWLGQVTREEVSFLPLTPNGRFGWGTSTVLGSSSACSCILRWSSAHLSPRDPSGSHSAFQAPVLPLWPSPQSVKCRLLHCSALTPSSARMGWGLACSPPDSSHPKEPSGSAFTGGASPSGWDSHLETVFSCWTLVERLEEG